jgi:hypothetical protein
MLSTLILSFSVNRLAADCYGIYFKWSLPILRFAFVSLVIAPRDYGLKDLWSLSLICQRFWKYFSGLLQKLTITLTWNTEFMHWYFLSCKLINTLCTKIALMMEAANTSETSVNFYHITLRNNAERSHLQTCRRENLKSHKLCIIFRWKQIWVGLEIR